MKSYVVGFLFDKTLENVVLIRKNRPEWQRNKWNGVGGHIEEGETAACAMAREFEEETGKAIGEREWKGYGRLHGPGWEIFLFFAVDGHEGITTKTDEVVERWGVASILTGQAPIPVLGNIRWHLQMAMAVARREDRCTYFDIEEVR